MRKPIVAVLAGTVTVVSVALGGVASAMDKAVTLTVDGETQQVHVWGSTVGDALEAQELVIGDYDEVSPAASTPISDGTEIDVKFARQITITIDGVQQTFWTTATTVDEALAEIGLHDPDARLSVDRSLPLGREGLTLAATTAKDVTLVVGGQPSAVRSSAPDVAALLSENDIVVDADDRVSEALGARVTAGMTVTVQKVEVSEVTENQPIPHETNSTDDDSRARGTTEVTTEGVDGEKTVVYQIVVVDGAEESRTVVSETVVTEPVTEEVRVGTGTAPGGNGNSSGNGTYTGSHADWMAAAGIAPSDYAAVEILVQRESSWNPNAVNASSGACGLVQALPCSKLGANWNDPVVALRWGDQYVRERYGGWSGALAHSYANGWY